MSFDVLPPRLRNAKCERLGPGQRVRAASGERSPWHYRHFGDGDGPAVLVLAMSVPGSNIKSGRPYVRAIPR
jgi:hypothetical protein